MGWKWTGAVSGCLGMALGTFSLAGAATMGSHYNYGIEGVLAGSAPPPGFHYRMYNVFYDASDLTNNSGDSANVGFDLEAAATAQRLIYVTNIKILGADYLYDVIVPFVDQDVTIAALGVSDSHSLSVGDITVEPFVLGWHGARWDATFGLGVVLPTGSYDASEAASPGLGYWSGLLTLGGTYYLDQQRTWSISALTRTLVNSEQDDTNVTPGSEFVIEYGLGKEFKVGNSCMIRPGLTGYSYWQIEDDSDDQPPMVDADQRKQVHAVGAELNLFWLPQLFQVNFRYLQEYGAENSPEGSQFIATLTKSF